jgi:hypothetical protein
VYSGAIILEHWGNKELEMARKTKAELAAEREAARLIMITETREWIVKYKSPSAGTAKVPLDKTVAFYKEHLARDYYLEKVRDGRPRSS